MFVLAVLAGYTTPVAFLFLSPEKQVNTDRLETGYYSPCIGCIRSTTACTGWYWNGSEYNTVKGSKMAGTSGRECVCFLATGGILRVILNELPVIIYNICLPPIVFCSFTILIAPISKTCHAPLCSRGVINQHPAWYSSL